MNIQIPIHMQMYAHMYLIKVPKGLHNNEGCTYVRTGTKTDGPYTTSLQDVTDANKFVNT